MSARYFKILKGLNSCHGGSHLWKVGETTKEEFVNPCHSGWHFVNLANLKDWIGLELTIYEVTVPKGAYIVHEYDKIVANQLTLGKPIGTFTKQKVKKFYIKNFQRYIRHMRFYSGPLGKDMKKHIDFVEKTFYSHRSHKYKWNKISTYWQVLSNTRIKTKEDGFFDMIMNFMGAYPHNGVDGIYVIDVPASKNRELGELILEVVSK